MKMLPCVPEAEVTKTSNDTAVYISSRNLMGQSPRTPSTCYTIEGIQYMGNSCIDTAAVHFLSVKQGDIL